MQLQTSGGSGPGSRGGSGAGYGDAAGYGDSVGYGGSSGATMGVGWEEDTAALEGALLEHRDTPTTEE